MIDWRRAILTKIMIGLVSGLASIRHQANDKNHWAFMESLDEYEMHPTK